jgi:uncharacterized repeat protein (TIGR01451 family)
VEKPPVVETPPVETPPVETPPAPVAPVAPTPVVTPAAAPSPTPTRTAKPRARLRVVKTGPARVRAGHLVLFRIRVVNSGKGTAVRLRVRDLLPSSLVLAGRHRPHLRGGLPTWHVRRLAPGHEKVLRIVVKALGPGRISRCNRVVVSGGNTAPAGARACLRVVPRPRRVPAVTG